MIDIVVPQEQEGTQAVVRNWLKKPGDHVAQNDPLVELETDKVTMEVPAPAAGILSEILLQTDAKAEPGALLGRLTPLAMEVKNERPPVMDVAFDNKGAASELRLSPSVRRAIKEYGIDPTTIAGSGRGGRVTRADVEAKARALADEAPLLADDMPVRPGLPPPVMLASTTSVPHDRMRRMIAENMLNSVTVAPHVTSVFEADFSAIIAHRNKHKAAFERQGAKLTFTAYFIAAAVKAMRVVPAINSRWHETHLEMFPHVNIGIGTALGDKGLVVPVIAQAQDLSLLGIAMRLQDVTARARDNKLTPADMKGGTFTISNHGVSGSLLAAPIIILQPQSAILGVGKLEKRVVVREVNGVDSIQIRPLCYVSLTIDHRVVDGHQTNGWLSSFVQTIEGWPLDD